MTVTLRYPRPVTEHRGTAITTDQLREAAALIGAAGTMEEDALAELLEAVAAWQDEGLGTCPQIENTNFPDAWADVARIASAVARATLASR